MDTPYTNHLTKQDYEFVYEPSEDSYFLLDALEADLSFIKNLKPLLCVEIGSGSGIIITALAKQLKLSYCLAVDINYKACLASKKTASRNSANLEVIHMDVTNCLQPIEIDLLVFNPPYVLTEEDDKNKFSNQTLAHAWDGGPSGRRITDRILKNLENILSPGGVFYLLVLKENNLDTIIQHLDSTNFTAVKFMERKIPGEHLYVLKIVRKA